MLRSLVGSEMCIRDRCESAHVRGDRSCSETSDHTQDTRRASPRCGCAGVFSAWTSTQSSSHIPSRCRAVPSGAHLVLHQTGDITGALPTFPTLAGLLSSVDPLVLDQPVWDLFGVGLGFIWGGGSSSCNVCRDPGHNAGKKTQKPLGNPKNTRETLKRGFGVGKGDFGVKKGFRMEK